MDEFSALELKVQRMIMDDLETLVTPEELGKINRVQVFIDSIGEDKMREIIDEIRSDAGKLSEELKNPVSLRDAIGSKELAKRRLYLNDVSRSVVDLLDVAFIRKAAYVSQCLSGTHKDEGIAKYLLRIIKNPRILDEMRGHLYTKEAKEGYKTCSTSREKIEKEIEETSHLRDTLAGMGENNPAEQREMVAGFLSVPENVKYITDLADKETEGMYLDRLKMVLDNLKSIRKNPELTIIRKTPHPRSRGLIAKTTTLTICRNWIFERLSNDEIDWYRINREKIEENLRDFIMANSKNVYSPGFDRVNFNYNCPN